MRAKHPHPLATYRSKVGLSQYDLAKQLGIGRWMVNSIETGRRNPSPRLTLDIEAKTGVPREQLRPDIYGETHQ